MDNNDQMKSEEKDFSDKTQEEIIQEIEELKKNVEVEEDLGLLNKFNNFVKKIVKSFLAFWYSPIGKMIIIISVGLMLILPIGLVVLGFDKLFIRSTLDGKVVNSEGELISDAEIFFQGQVAKSDENGRFTLKNLDYGKARILIKKDGFNEYSEAIIINRFGNSQEFELLPLDFGILKGALVSNVFDIDGLQLSLNDKRIEVGDDGSFQSERLIVGKYKMKFSSDKFKDFEGDVEVKNGTTNLEPIKLEPAGDLVGEVKDFVTGQIVEGVEVKVTNYQEPIQFLDNKFTLKDLDISKLQITFKKEGYQEKILELEIKQGSQNTVIAELVPTFRVNYYLNGNIINSFTDGSDQVNISGGRISCELLNDFGDSIAFKCADKIYSSDTKGESIQIGSSANSLDGVISKGLVVFNNSTQDRMVLKLNAGGETKIFTSESENVISWYFDETTSIFYFSTEVAVYKYDLNQNTEAVVITNGIFYIQDKKPGENKLLTLNYTTPQKDVSNIWEISDNGERSRATILAEDFKYVRYISSSQIIYTKQSAGVTSLYKKDLVTTNEKLLIENVDKFVINRNVNIIVASRGPRMYILDSNQNVKKVL